MERRTFLKGAALAAATPAVAFAPVIAETIGNLIGQHTTLDEMFQAVDAEAGKIGKDPSKPAYPHIYAHEFGPYRSGMWTREKAFFTEADIVALFDRERNYADLNEDHWTPERRAEVIADANDRQRRALELFRLRKAVYNEWRRSSGFAVLSDEKDRLGTLLSGLEDKILGFRPGSLDDVRSKALFVDRIYGSAPPEDIIGAFVKSLIA